MQVKSIRVESSRGEGRADIPSQDWRALPTGNRGAFLHQVQTGTGAAQCSCASQDVASEFADVREARRSMEKRPDE